MHTLAKYTLPCRPSPSLCEDLQRKLDAIDPRCLLDVVDCQATVTGPLTSSVLAPFREFIEDVKNQHAHQRAKWGFR